MKAFSAKEDKLLRENWLLRDKDELIKLFPNRTWNSISGHGRRSLQLPARSQRWWKNTEPMQLADFDRGFTVASVDGEGSLIIHRCARNADKYQCFNGFTFSPEISIGNTIRSFLEKAQRMIGGYITKGQKPTKPNHKQCFHLRVTGLNNICRLLQTIGPDLTVKAKQCVLMLEYCKSRMDAIRDKGTRDSHYSPREIEIANEIHRLNNGLRLIVGEEV